MVSRKKTLVIVGIMLLSVALGVHGQVRKGVLKVSSNPDGATVFISGKQYGPTPVFVELPAGRHKMTVTKDGFPPRKETVMVESGRISYSKVYFKAQQKTGIRVHDTRVGGKDSGPGTVNVATIPSGLTVFMNGLIVPQPTPVSFDVRAGIYELSIEKEGSEVLKKTIFVRAGRSIELQYTINQKRKIDDSDPWL